MARCQACGRPLRRPSPSGFGPVCAERLGIPAPPSRRAATLRRPPAIRTDPPVEISPGQTALDLQTHQPSPEENAVTPAADRINEEQQ